MKPQITPHLMAALLGAALAAQSYAQSTAFTYQGRLTDNGAPASGSYDLRFALYEVDTGGAEVTGAITNSPVAVSNGLFTVLLDFGNQFPGANRWLELGVRPIGGGAFTTLSPRQRLTAIPYAVQAGNANTALTAATAGSASSVAASNLVGTLPLAQLPATVVTNGASGLNLSGTFLGNGIGLTNIPINSLVFPPDVLVWGDNAYGQTTVPPQATNVIAIAAGVHHTVALRANGSVLAWGYNFDGQTTVPPQATNVIAIAAGGSHTVALRGDGSVLAWGNNNQGQTTVPPQATNVIAIAAGGSHTVALRGDGSVLAWGYNSSGQTTVPPQATNIIAIAAGDYHTVALRGDGSVLAWGHNFTGQTTVPPQATNVIAIAAGNAHTVALRADGSVLAWGYNENGQTNVPPQATNVIAIAAGNAHTVALRADGSVLAWGYNLFGQASVPPQANYIIAIAAGRYHSVALRKAPLQVAARLDGNNIFTGANQFAGITSPKWKATTVINTNLALPISAAFTSGGGTLVIYASGSGYTASAGLIGMDILLDSVTIESCLGWANATFSHLSFVPKTFVRTGVAAGTHTIQLNARSGTLTSTGQDFFTVTIMELPF